jgi:hypothetical protein
LVRIIEKGSEIRRDIAPFSKDVMVEAFTLGSVPVVQTINVLTSQVQDVYGLLSVPPKKAGKKKRAQ